MALAFVARRDLSLHVAHDERTAAFIALGIGLESGVPAAVLCTSGTAATHFHAAVVEAHLAGVPMLVLTADRPPELHGIGAPQTIDQHRLFTTSGRFVDAGVANIDERTEWRARAMSWWPVDGPVHVNLPFREPLVGTPSELPAGRDVEPGAPDHQSDGAEQVPSAPALLAERRGVLVVGRGVDHPQAVADLGTALGWPVLADPRSGCRGLPGVVGAFDSLLRHDAFARDHRPAAVLHLGEPPASKVLGQWLAASGARHVQVLQRHAVVDPLQIISERHVASVGVTCRAWRAQATGATGTPWLARWTHAEERAQAVLSELLGGPDLDEPTVARVVTSRSGPLVVCSSMPIRDVEWFGHPGEGATVLANRGANGIDGVMATATGVALASGQPTTVLLGDVAFCHDASSLTALARRNVTLRIVVIDNDGGGIFSFLPQADVLPAERFEKLFGTPHGTDVVAVAEAHGVAASQVTTVDELQAFLSAPGVGLARVKSNRQRNVEVHRALNAAVAAALDESLGNRQPGR
jgi:2-succinyl-5-enolpyruvyl-6-hydroxy-3-cyclohexene-1-carboxylate synthase